ncbi:MAG: BACON domain-containing protein [Bacteroidales bacterium]|nr:BACON domain-containing protein [Bacteroidales bacterium]
MKTVKLICASILSLVLAFSCKKEAEPVTFSSDPAALTEIPCMDPDDQVLNLTTNANWIVVTPSWVKADPIFGSGNAIVSFKVESTYINDKTDVAPRTGEIVFSGGGKSYIVPISQLGYTVPYDPSASIGGIPDVDEFMKFVQAVNENEGITRWQNANKEVELLADINLSEFTEWTPIGAVESVTNGNYAGGYAGGNPFKGVFIDNGHTIRGFKPTVKVAENGTFGLFGVLEGATIKDLNLETDLVISAKAQADAGVLVGTAISSTIQNVKVSGKITSAGTETNSKRYALGGIAGFVFNTGEGTSLIKDCTTNLVVNADCGNNTANGATGTMYGGVAGFVTTSQDNSANDIEGCVNSGEINAKLGRASGIVATANYGGHFKDCTNNANQVNTFANGRIGNVISVLYKNAVADGLVNNGNLTTTASDTHAGAIIGFFNDDAIVMKGGKNTGTVIAANVNQRGLIGANISKFAEISGVTVGGKLGTYKEDGNHEMIDVNAGNFEQYIGAVSDANRAKISGLTWDGAPAPVIEGIASAADLKEFANLVKTGGDVTKFMVDGVVVLGTDIDLAGEEWTPIGEGSVTTAGVITAGDVPYTGVFDGKGHTVDNFTISVPATGVSGYAAGLFGILSGATVKNVVIGSKVVIEGKSEALTYLGGVAGFALNSTVEGCTNKGKVSVTAATDNIRECVGGIVGQVYTGEGASDASYIKNCVNEGTVTSKNSVNTKNGGTGLSVAGIAGFTDGKNFTYIQFCTNKAAISAEATRLAGIVASANAKTKVEDCVNEGKISGLDVKASNSRVAGICSGGSTDDSFIRCINRGDIVFDKSGDSTHGYAAGILGQSNNPLTIDACENYGSILSDMFKAGTVYMGSILGNANKKATTIKNCKVGGKVGPLTEDDTHKVVTLTADNFASYITLANGDYSKSCIFENNVFGNQ